MRGTNGYIHAVAALFFMACSGMQEPEGVTNEWIVTDNSFDLDMNSQESFSAYKNWLVSGESGHFRETKIGDFVFSGLVEPSAYSFLKNEGQNGTQKFSEADYENQIRAEYRIKVPRLNGELIRYMALDEQEYADRIQYYSFHAHEDFALIAGQDTIACGMAVWEREYNVSPTVRLQLIFDAPGRRKNHDRLQLIYYDRVFHHGWIKLSYS